MAVLDEVFFFSFLMVQNLVVYSGLGRLGSGFIVGLGGLNMGQGEVGEALAAFEPRFYSMNSAISSTGVKGTRATRLSNQDK